jgi:hypothetical protein
MSAATRLIATDPFQFFEAATAAEPTIAAITRKSAVSARRPRR